MPTKIKKPTLALGEYGPATTVAYRNDEQPEFSGEYVVELGAEFRNEDGWNKHTRRWVRVNGSPFQMYAMVKVVGPGKSRTIERDEDVLQQRAVRLYVRNVLQPQLEERQRQAEVEAPKLQWSDTNLDSMLGTDLAYLFLDDDGSWASNTPPLTGRWADREEGKRALVAALRTEYQQVLKSLPE